MPFVIACSECKAKLKIADEHRGKTFNCPKCRAKVVAIEENAIPTPAPQTAPANASPAFPSQPQIAALKDEPKSTFPIDTQVNRKTEVTAEPQVGSAATGVPAQAASGISLIAVITLFVCFVTTGAFAFFLFSQLDSSITAILPFTLLLGGCQIAAVVNSISLANQSKVKPNLLANYFGSIVVVLGGSFVAFILFSNARLFSIVLGIWTICALITFFLLLSFDSTEPSKRGRLGLLGWGPIFGSVLASWAVLGLLYLSVQAAQQKFQAAIAEQQRIDALPENRLKRAVEQKNVAEIDAVLTENRNLVEKPDPALLASAIMLGDSAVVKRLAAQGIDFNKISEGNAVVFALMKNRRQIAMDLLKSGTSFPIDLSSPGPLKSQVLKGDYELVEAMLTASGIQPGKEKVVNNELLKGVLLQEGENSTKLFKLLLDYGLRFSNNENGWEAIAQGYQGMNKAPAYWNNHASRQKIEMLVEYGVPITGNSKKQTLHKFATLRLETEFLDFISNSIKATNKSSTE